VVALGTAKGRWKARFGDLEVWERDEHSRRTHRAGARQHTRK